MTFLRPRPIEKADNTAGFHSGEATLDRYLTERALANHVSGFARAYVCIENETGKIAGYYTLSAIAIEHSQLSGRARRNAPNPVPAVLLGRLAVDRTAQGAGLGRLLVRDAILSTLAAADRIGVRLMLVHALHDEAADFYSKLGFLPSPTDPLHLYLSLPDARRSLDG
ncbi:Acetyltransferase (GNAT) domain-containing protein [Tessaracoccus bendigoensis DSM 12906]|uniref:Acetyltransferase (GNAT) domain-containing protein n=1 Tax=Tessaracoccus bendigoensis DSM 12906 TaxID=1123357 RepID=A0A1M6G4I5_9ACTN|nr:GNAT family N-acetyltransferase [Tessaracoccus bendigoensis]SHJ04901.1 Acetyltransferase (GNAT) domain-containing protein [Tessaracoccus bendigoensis DSM 12906]